MRKKRSLSLPPYLLTLAMMVGLSAASYAQQTVVSGKITDAETGDAVPFANVLFKGTDVGTTTNFDGIYQLSTTEAVDTLLVSYIGFVTREKAIASGETQTINIQLSPDVVSLQEVVFYAGENPAFEVLRRVNRQREANDWQNLKAYAYESYTKVEMDVDHLPDAGQNKLLHNLTSVLDSLKKIAGEDGNPIIPIFMSETISQMYYRNNPNLRRENVIKSKVTGVGLEADSWLSQLTGSSFQQYDFYDNWLNIVDKEFISPIATSGRGYYEYDLTDSLYVGEDFCYQLDFFPKSKQDLAFSGTVWITKKEYALRQIDVTVGDGVNLNYVEKIRIQQELAPTETGAWLPLKTRVLVDTEELGNSLGILAKFYSANRDFVVNDKKPTRFYETAVSLSEQAYTYDSSFWNNHRYEPLTDTELNVYAMIDTLNDIPTIRTYATIIDIVVSGYKSAGPVDIGPYLYTYAYNSVEGSRFRLGGRTNTHFSNKWTLRGYGAYGIRDKRFKYGGGIDYILSRTPWTTLSVDYAHDLGQLGIYAEELADDNNYIFYAASFFGNLSRAYRFDRSSVSLFRQLPAGFSTKLTLRNERFDPLFGFAYLETPHDQESPLNDRFATSEVRIETRFARDEEFLQQGNRRISLDTRRWPIFKATYVLGVKNLLGGDFQYHKVQASIDQYLNLGFLGTSRYELEGSYVFNPLPYPLLTNHLGNESFFYTSAAYNTMNRNEFVSDRYVALHYQHSFQGFILNRIPLMRRLKWRLVASSNVLYGGLRQENLALLPETDAVGEPLAPVNFLDKRPYVEVGYGIENILRVGRIDFFHRLTYLDRPDVNKFHVKVSFQIIL